MNFKLCYKSYDFKINLAACKYFYDNTGLDLQCLLMKYIYACHKSCELSLLERMILLNEVCSFEHASYAIHSLVRQEDKSVPLDEIQDGMFKVSWLETDDDTGYIEPWPLVLVSIATSVNDYFVKNISKKKADTKQ